mgnify:CR=1 FL=1|jgi:hypothetical protein
MATYKFYFATTTDDNLEEDYTSNTNIIDVETEFKINKGNVTKVTRIDILADPDLINTDEALGYERN